MVAYRTETVAFSLESFFPGPRPGFFLVAMADVDVPAAADAGGGSEWLEVDGEPAPAVPDDGFLDGMPGSINSSGGKVVYVEVVVVVVAGDVDAQRVVGLWSSPKRSLTWSWSSAKAVENECGSGGGK